MTGSDQIALVQRLFVQNMVALRGFVIVLIPAPNGSVVEIGGGRERDEIRGVVIAEIPLRWMSLGVGLRLAFGGDVGLATGCTFPAII